jgi:hypothetical protein
MEFQGSGEWGRVFYCPEGLEVAVVNRNSKNA